MKPLFKRVLLKISGEALSGSMGFGLDYDYIDALTLKIADLVKMDVEVGLVTGGGNYWRGRSAKSFSRVTSDHIGMMGTVINGMAIQDCLFKHGIDSFLVSALSISKIADNLNRYEIDNRLKQHGVAIFVSGTGNPYFSTDTTAAIRASEIKADVILFGKHGVDGVYDKDPNVFSDAKKFDVLSMTEIMNKKLDVFDQAAAKICIDNKMPAVVFGMDDLNNIIQVIREQSVGTYVKGE